MKQIPILFSAPMVRAILDGRKTQTRRVLKADFMHQPDGSQDAKWYFRCQRQACWDSYETLPELVERHSRHGKPGDRLWVRETWGYNPDFPGMPNHACYCADPGHEYDGIKWKPSIHMPRSVCRIQLEVTGVRIERLNDCSFEDALAEGIPDYRTLLTDERGHGESPDECARRLRWPQRQYAQLWDEINGAGAWAANPWVWVVEFRRFHHGDKP